MSDQTPRGTLMLQRDRPHLSTFVQIPDMNVIEILARTGLDSFILDCQHGMYAGDTISSSIAAATAADRAALVRIPVGDFAFAARALDLGAGGIVCPMVSTVEDARAFVAHVKYPPVGERSWGPRRALPLSGLAGLEYLHRANSLTTAFVMIETAAGLDNLDAILSVDGVDGVFVGPTDLCVSLTAGTALDVEHPAVIAAVERIGDACRRANKWAGIFALDATQAAAHIRRGYAFIALAQDAMFMTQAAAAACRQTRELAAAGAALG